MRTLLELFDLVTFLCSTNKNFGLKLLPTGTMATMVGRGDVARTKNGLNTSCQLKVQTFLSSPFTKLKFSTTTLCKFFETYQVPSCWGRRGACEGYLDTTTVILKQIWKSDSGLQFTVFKLITLDASRNWTYSTHQSSVRKSPSH